MILIKVGEVVHGEETS